MTMKSRFVWMLATLLLVCGKPMTAQTAEDTAYVALKDMPDARVFLPLPPDSSSLEYMDDMVQFQWARHSATPHKASKPAVNPSGRPGGIRSKSHHPHPRDLYD